MKDYTVSLQGTEQKISETALAAVAEHKQVDELELYPPLSEVIDPEALDSLFRGRGTRGNVRFNYCDCTVTVDQDGHVTVRDEDVTVRDRDDNR